MNIQKFSRRIRNGNTELFRILHDVRKISRKERNLIKNTDWPLWTRF
jgi:hypothetical protein